jgi:hypothetical protein
MLSAKDTISKGADKQVERTYVGTVESNSDPLKLGRLRVRVTELYGDIPADHLPWANPSIPWGGAGPGSPKYTGDDGYGMFFIPVVGSKVRVRLFRGHPWCVEWYGVHWHKGETPTESQLNPPTNYVIKTPAGHLIDLHDTNGYIRIKDSRGNFITINSQEDNLLISIQNDKREKIDGDSDEIIGKSKRMDISGNLDITVDGSVNIKAGGVVAIEGSQIHLNSNVASPATPTAPEDVTHEVPS